MCSKIVSEGWNPWTKDAHVKKPLGTGEARTKDGFLTSSIYIILLCEFVKPFFVSSVSTASVLLKWEK